MSLMGALADSCTRRDLLCLYAVLSWITRQCNWGSLRSAGPPTKPDVATLQQLEKKGSITILRAMFDLGAGIVDSVSSDQKMKDKMNKSK